MLEPKCFLLINSVVEFEALDTILFTSVKRLGQSGNVLQDKFKKSYHFFFITFCDWLKHKCVLSRNKLVT
jgi:hypothetical protein